MKERAFFLISTLSGLISVFTNLIARDKGMEGVVLRVNAIMAASRDHVKYVPNPVAAQLLHQSHILNWIGNGLAFSCLACLIAASIRREPGWYSIPLLLLVADLFALLLL